MTPRFEVGKTYWTRSACDHECIYRFTVVSRTEKTVTLSDPRGERVQRRKVRMASWLPSGVEACDPLGRYSMSPVITAVDVWED